MTSTSSQQKPQQAWTTNRYLRAIFSYRFGFFLYNAFFWALMHSMPILLGLAIKGVFDAMSAYNTPLTWLMLGLFLFAQIARMVVFGEGVRVYTKYWTEIHQLLQRNMLDYLLNAKGSRRLPESSGKAVTRFRDDLEDVVRLLEAWVDFWGFALFAVLALIIMFRIDPIMTLVMCLPLIFIFLLTRQLVPTIRRYRRRSREATEAVTGFIGEMFTSVQAVKVAGRYESVLGHFDKLNRTRRNAALKDTLLIELLHGLNINMVNIGIAVMLFFAAYSMSEGRFTLGEFSLFISYLPRLTGVMAFIGDMIASHKRAGVAFERVNKLLVDAPPEQIVQANRIHFDPFYDPKPAQHPKVSILAHHLSPISASAENSPFEALRELRVEGLSYKHVDGPVAFQDVSFSLSKGSFTVITGRIGSGKSMLVKVLLGLLPKTSGKIYWNDREVSDPASFFVPPYSAYTPQVPRLFSSSLQENILLGQDENRLEEAIKLAVLSHDIDNLEAGLESTVGTRGVKLSGGQVQRSAAARMFAQHSEILIFDDLSSALDVKTEQQLWEGIFNKGQQTCLVVSHRRPALERADQIILMDEGKILAMGKLAELSQDQTLVDMLSTEESH
ncbi:MAG: ABC transporter ATP-binding protein [Deinococcales bacterium]